MKCKHFPPHSLAWDSGNSQGGASFFPSFKYSFPLWTEPRLRVTPWHWVCVELGLPGASTGFVWCRRWVCVVPALGLPGASTGLARCRCWVCMVLALGLRDAGFVQCWYWVSKVLVLGLHGAGTGFAWCWCWVCVVLPCCRPELPGASASAEAACVLLDRAPASFLRAICVTYTGFCVPIASIWRPPLAPVIYIHEKEWCEAAAVWAVFSEKRSRILHRGSQRRMAVAGERAWRGGKGSSGRQWAAWSWVPRL